MPKQGQSVESCIITEWFKKKGDKVKPGDILFSYETDKASFEEESTTEGILLDIFFDKGEDVPVLTNVAVIGEANEKYDNLKPGNVQTPEEKKMPESQTIVTEEKPEGKISSTDVTNKKIKISPRAKLLAEKSGIAANNIKGSGPNGRIMVKDIVTFVNIPVIEKTVQVTYSDGADFEVKPVSNIRKIIAKSMQASLQNSAQLTHHLSADARRMLDYRNKIKKLRDAGSAINITLNDMVCFAVIKALKKHPAVNSHFLGETAKIFKKVHLGIAVDTERGLMVPTLKNADDFSIEGLSNRLKSLSESCKKGNIDPELLASTSASFTVSNLGAYGIEIFTPVINLPQSAILGVNTIILRPADVGNNIIGFVPFMGLSLTYDHRALDGAPASAFLKEIKEQIENLELNF